MDLQAKSDAPVLQFRQTLPRVVEERSLHLKYLNADQYDRLEDITISVKKMLTALLKKLKT